MLGFIQYFANPLLRGIQRANAIFGRYAKMYYDDNFTTSVYFFDIDGSDSSRHGFGSSWLIKKCKSLAIN